MAGRPYDRVDVELVEDDGRHGGGPDAAGGTDRRPANGRDGTLRAEFEGVLAEPEMSDGSESGVFLVTRSDRETLVGVDARTGAQVGDRGVGKGERAHRSHALFVRFVPR